MKNIAVIGCGYWGKNLVRNFYNLGTLHTICDSDRGKEIEIRKGYEGVGYTTDYKYIMRTGAIKAVVIASPAETHFRLVREALLNDKDVFVEKPLALKMGEAKELVGLVEHKKRILMVDHILHYHPAIIKLKELIREDILGGLQYVYSNRLNIGKFRKEENILWSFAPHDISVILALIGRMPVGVKAFGEAYLQKDIYDTTLTTLTFNDRLKAHIFVSWLHPFKEQKLVVIGSRNMAVFDDQAAEKLTLYPHKVEWVSGMPIASKAPHKTVPIASVEPLTEACRHFISCVEKRTEPLTNGEEALRVLEILSDAQVSLERNSYEEKKGQR